MALTSRITLTGAPAEDPEDFFGASLGVIFPDDVMNQRECFDLCCEVLQGREGVGCAMLGRSVRLVE